MPTMRDKRYSYASYSKPRKWYTKQTEVTLCRVSSKDNESQKDILQAIIYNNGFTKIGIDVWRELNLIDYPSYPVTCFKSVEDMQQVFDFRPEFGFETAIATKKIFKDLSKINHYQKERKKV